MISRVSYADSRGGSPMATTIAEGDRLLIIDRKLYKEDNMRLFVGVVEGSDGQIVRVQGYPFHLNPYEISGSERHGELRTRIVSLISGDLIYLMAPDLDIAKLQLRRSPKSLMLTDGEDMSLDLSEWLVRM
jgi:hypothetical protein